MSIPFYAIALPALLLLTTIMILRCGLYSDEAKYSAAMTVVYVLSELVTNGRYTGLQQSVLVAGLLLSVCASAYMLYRAAGGN